MELEAFSRLFGTFAGIRLGVQSLVVAEPGLLLRNFVLSYHCSK